MLMPDKSRLFNRGFLSLLTIQFFGAANDNLLKGVLSFGVAAGGLWASQLGEGGARLRRTLLNHPLHPALRIRGTTGRPHEQTPRSRFWSNVQK